MDFSLTIYYPIFLYLLIILGVAVATLVAAHLIGPRHKTPIKDMTYESGMDPIGNARQQFDVKFYLIAILFLVFDVELLFLYPWAASYQVVDPNSGGDLKGAILPYAFQPLVFWEVLIFLATVVVAYVYAWRRGVFRWR